MSEHFPGQDSQRFGDVVVTEHRNVIDQEYRWGGQVRHRQRREHVYAACCLACKWSVMNVRSMVQIRNMAKGHRCEENN